MANQKPDMTTSELLLSVDERLRKIEAVGVQAPAVEALKADAAKVVDAKVTEGLVTLQKMMNDAISAGQDKARAGLDAISKVPGQVHDLAEGLNELTQDFGVLRARVESALSQLAAVASSGQGTDALARLTAERLEGTAKQASDTATQVGDIRSQVQRVESGITARLGEVAAALDGLDKRFAAYVTNASEERSAQLAAAVAELHKANAAAVPASDKPRTA